MWRPSTLMLRSRYAATLGGGLAHVRACEVCTFGRPSCASSDARVVHTRTHEMYTFWTPWTPELCTFGRPKCARSHARAVNVWTPEVCTLGRPKNTSCNARSVHIRTPELCTFGRPNCACAQARGVHTRTPKVCTFGRPKCAHLGLLHGKCCTGRPPMRCTGKFEQSCQQGYVPSMRSHCPQHQFSRVRCLRKKVPFCFELC